MISYEIIKHESAGDQLVTCIKSLNNPVTVEHVWGETDKLNPTAVMTWLIAQLTYLDETYVAPIAPISNIPEANAIIINPIDVSAALDAIYYPLWAADTWYNVDEKLTYNGAHYKVVQAHRSQADWLPNLLPALYTNTSAPNVTVPDWVQPTGAQDDYAIGDHVMFEGHEYASLIDGNVWSPTAYPAGWQLIA